MLRLYEFTDQGQAIQFGVSEEAIFASDEFRMYAYKIRRCPRTRSHDWTECPYAHRGEKAQRRDPRRHSYAAVVCPSFRAGATCDRGDSCEFAHGVFEYWLHPTRYRTRACNSGRLCQRKVCFFAHSPDELRRPEPSAAKLLRRSHFAYRARAAAAAAAAAVAPVMVEREESFEKFAEFLRSLRALKLGGDDEVAMAPVVTETDCSDLVHLDWVSELVK